MSAALIAVVVSLLLGHLVPSLPLLRRYDWFIGWLHWLGRQTSGDEWPNRIGLLLAVGLPLLVVGIVNKLLTLWIPGIYGTSHSFDPAVIGSAAPVVQEVSKVAAIWAVQGALLVGIASVILFAWKPVFASFAEGTKSAIGGALVD